MALVPTLFSAQSAPSMNPVIGPHQYPGRATAPQHRALRVGDHEDVVAAVDDRTEPAGQVGRIVARPDDCRRTSSSSRSRAMSGLLVSGSTLAPCTRCHESLITVRGRAGHARTRHRGVVHRAQDLRELSRVVADIHRRFEGSTACHRLQLCSASHGCAAADTATRCNPCPGRSPDVCCTSQPCR